MINICTPFVYFKIIINQIACGVPRKCFDSAVMEVIYGQVITRGSLTDKKSFEFSTKDSEENVCAFLDQFFKGNYDILAHHLNFNMIDLLYVIGPSVDAAPEKSRVLFTRKRWNIMYNEDYLKFAQFASIKPVTYRDFVRFRKRHR
jgi:hypothetical protein